MPGVGALGQFALGQFPTAGIVSDQEIVDTVVLPLPINCVLAEHEKIKMDPNELEPRSNWARNKVRVKSSQITRMSGPAPSFVTTTRKLGSFD